MSDIMASFILFHYRNLILAKNEELLIYHLHISYFDFKIKLLQELFPFKVGQRFSPP